MFVVFLSVCPSDGPSVYQPIWPFVHPSHPLSFCESICLSISQSVRQAVGLSVQRSVHLSVPPFVQQSVPLISFLCPLVCLSVFFQFICPSLWLSVILCSYIRPFICLSSCPSVLHLSSIYQTVYWSVRLCMCPYCTLVCLSIPPTIL